MFELIKLPNSLTADEQGCAFAWWHFLAPPAQQSVSVVPAVRSCQTLSPNNLVLNPPLPHFLDKRRACAKSIVELPSLGSSLLCCRNHLVVRRWAMM